MSPHNQGLGTEDTVAANKLAATVPSSTEADTTQRESVSELLIARAESEIDETDSGIVSTVDPEVVAQPSKRLEIVVAVVALLFNVALLFAAQTIELRRDADPGQIDARFWPTILALLGISLSIARLVVSIISKPDDRDDLERVQPGQMNKLIITLALTAAYLGAWSLKTATLTLFGLVIGFKLFVIATPFYLAALLFLFGARGWKSLVIYPIITTGFIYLLFGELLRIAL